VSSSIWFNTLIVAPSLQGTWNSHNWPVSRLIQESRNTMDFVWNGHLQPPIWPGYTEKPMRHGCCFGRRKYSEPEFTSINFALHHLSRCYGLKYIHSVDSTTAAFWTLIMEYTQKVSASVTTGSCGKPGESYWIKTSLLRPMAGVLGTETGNSRADIVGHRKNA
jgi:hypothetical protein